MPDGICLSFLMCSSLQICPSHIPDLLSGCPLFISGRYCGTFPDSVEVGGTLADFGKFEIKVKVQNAKDIPVDRVMFQLTNNAFRNALKCILNF